MEYRKGVSALVLNVFSSIHQLEKARRFWTYAADCKHWFCHVQARDLVTSCVTVSALH